ncbi:glutathione binding-like protein [Caulobacter sp. S45]|uniref:glutathione binding-like protein n=1 Tax=Caulobacter sp. S45 TaxID=1641861 RepID=UPI0035304EBA
MEPNQSPERAATARATADAALPLFERQLDRRAWLCGDRLTITDIVAGSGLGFGRMIAYQVGEAYPNLQRWAKAAMARPGAKPKR